MALLAVQQGFFAVNQPTRVAIIPRIVPLDLVPAANALEHDACSASASSSGRCSSGCCSRWSASPWLYFLDALTLVAILYAVFRLPPIPPLTERRGSRAKVIDGLRYLRLRPCC